MRSVIVLGLGNTLMTDDGVGIHVVRRVKDLLDPELDAAVDVVEAEYAGFALIGILEHYSHAIVVDAVHLPDTQAGVIRVLPASRFLATGHLAGTHQIDLPTALAIAAQLGLQVPFDVQIVGIQAQIDREFGEVCTPSVLASIEPAARLTVQLAKTLSTQCGR